MTSSPTRSRAPAQRVTREQGERAVGRTRRPPPHWAVAETAASSPATSALRARPPRRRDRVHLALGAAGVGLQHVHVAGGAFRGRGHRPPRARRPRGPRWVSRSRSARPNTPRTSTAGDGDAGGDETARLTGQPRPRPRATAVWASGFGRQRPLDRPSAAATQQPLGAGAGPLAHTLSPPDR